MKAIRRNIRLLGFCGLVMLIRMSEAPAQETAAGETGSSPRTSAFQVHLLGGFGMSYAMPILDQSTFRITLDANIRLRDTGGETKQRSSGSFSTNFQSSDVTSEQNSYDFTLVFSYVSHYSLSDEASFFFGFGPLARLAEYNDKSKSRVTSSSSSTLQSYESEFKTGDRGVGLRATMGFEVFVTRRLSFLGEYQASVTHLWVESESRSRYDYTNFFDEYTNSSEQTGWQKELNSVRLSIAVYL